MKSSARLQAIVAAVLFSTGGAAIKVDAFSGAQIASLRSGIAALTLLAIAHRRVAWSARAIAIGVVYAAVMILFVLATKLTTAANAIFLQSTAPIYLLALGPIALKEPLRSRDLLSVAAIAVGMALCFVGQAQATLTASDPATGNLLAAACGVAWAITLAALRWAQRDHSTEHIGLTAVVAGNVIAALTALPFAWPFPSPSAGAWMTVIYLGVFQVAIAYLCLTAAMRRLPALDAALLLLLEPVLNPIWAWVVRSERPGVWTLAGGTVIVVAAAVKSLGDATALATSGTKTL